MYFNCHLDCIMTAFTHASLSVCLFVFQIVYRLSIHLMCGWSIVYYREEKLLFILLFPLWLLLMYIVVIVVVIVVL